MSLPLATPGAAGSDFGLTEGDWGLLIGRIRLGKCTPFLGAGACVPTLPLGGEIARRWASTHGYPLGDEADLARVAQYLAVTSDGMAPKERLREEFGLLGQPDFDLPDEPHATLAKLGLPLYLTTNYDDFMSEALRREGRDVRRDFARWNNAPQVKNAPSVLRAKVVPTSANPVVFHLHGHFDVPESLVLTEDDYFTFLIATSGDRKLLPHQVSGAVSGTTLMFVGYRLADWDFRVIYRGLVEMSAPGLERLNVTVQLPPDDRARDYMESYFQRMNVRVFWGSAGQFMAELRRRWEARGADA